MTPFSCKYCPAGISFAIAPAGEIWSVVIESPKYPNTLKLSKGLIVSGSLDKPSKNGGFWIYVDSSDHSYNGSSVVSISFHFSFDSNRLSYSERKILGLTTALTSALISDIDGQMSFKYTSVPSLSFPKESFLKSKSTEPARA